MKFKSKREHFEILRKKWTARHKVAQNNFWEKHGEALKQVALGSLGGLMLLSSPSGQISPPHSFISRDDIINDYDKNIWLAHELQDKIPDEVRALNKDEEEAVTDLLSKNFGFKVKAEIDNIRFNRNYGLIGGEQHLYRYPGDNLHAHADSSADWAQFGGAGIAPGLGAWGYFATSKEEFKEIDKQRERYYLAMQTFLAPGFAENFVKYRDFFKFRKMLVINVKTGQAAAAVIGDAGPSEWTGKHLGGSPEVMDILGLAQGPRKGAVLYFFIDDPKNEVPLGPVKVRSKA